MATTYENMVLREMHKRETDSKKEWGLQHGSETTLYPLDSLEHQRLEQLKDKVADLCDLQPTQASMVRPPRKVRTLLSSTHAPSLGARESTRAPPGTFWHGRSNTWRPQLLSCV